MEGRRTRAGAGRFQTARGRRARAGPIATWRAEGALQVPVILPYLYKENRHTSVTAGNCQTCTCRDRWVRVLLTVTVGPRHGWLVACADNCQTAIRWATTGLCRDGDVGSNVAGHRVRAGGR